MKKLLFFILSIGFTASCQDFGKLQVVASLPGTLKEVSGIEVIDDGDLVWMVNDSGNAPKVYTYNLASKEIEKIITVTNAKNKDWEDLATDEKGNLFIGDFGNNISKRKNLIIYSVKKAALFTNDEVAAVKTNFYFEDQKKFPPKKKHRNFDVEAFIVIDNYFYLFTRNRSSDFDGTTKLYKIPAKEGSFEAKLIGSFKTCANWDSCQITSAAVDHLTGKIALLSSNKVWILSDYTHDNFFNGKIEKIKLKHYSQKESITFKNSNELFIADERSKHNGGNLYLLKL